MILYVTRGIVPRVAFARHCERSEAIWKILRASIYGKQPLIFECPTGLSGAPHSLRPQRVGQGRKMRNIHLPINGILLHLCPRRGCFAPLLSLARDIRAIPCRPRKVFHCSRSRYQHAGKAPQPASLTRNPYASVCHSGASPRVIDGSPMRPSLFYAKLTRDLREGAAGFYRGVLLLTYE
jgi:hypothetical protein